MNYQAFYKRQWEFIRSKHITLTILIALFIVSIVVGILFPEQFFAEQQAMLQELSSSLQGESFFNLFTLIVWNNALVAALTVFLGVTLIVPLGLLMVNGYIIGAVASQQVQQRGAGILVALLPHGIFELPAFLLAVMAGVHAGVTLITGNKVSPALRRVSVFFVGVVLPLLLVAALIETGLLVLLR